MIFKQLKEKEEFKKSYVIMSQLVHVTSEDEYLELLNEMRQEGYRLFVLTDEHDNYLSIAGVTIHTDFFNGKHMWINELVTIKEARSKGLGKTLIHQLEKVAVIEKCNKVILYSGMTRHEAHHFWEGHLDYERKGIVLKKQL